MKKNNTLNFYKSSILVAAFAMGFGFTSCDNDDDLVFSGKPVANAELRAFLQGKGYQFNEAGNLLMDAKVAATDSLDLSGTKISDLKDLVLFPNLKYVDLSDNGYGPVYDFANLPQNIKGVDLTGNEIYDFEGLVDAKMVNDELKTTILRKFSSLQLPATAKWNVEDLMPFYVQNKVEGNEVNMTMADENGVMKAYTTWREIPDEAFANYLKGIYGSIFSEDGKSIDISKPLALNESGKDLDLFYGDPSIKSPEGIEYFINNPFYESFSVLMSHIEPYTAAYMMPRANIVALDFTFFNTPMLDLSKATGLAHAAFVLNDDLKSIDLSNTLVMNQEAKDFDQTQSNMLFLSDCSNLKNVVLPQNMKGNIALLQLSNLPVLESVDLSAVKCAGEITLINLAKTAINYPTSIESQYDITTTKVVPFTEGGQVSFAISQDVFEKESTKNFINKYKANLYDNALWHEMEGAVYWSKLIK